MPPLRLTDSQITAVFAAVRPLAPSARNAFLLELATALAGIADPGDGDVARAQRQFFDPPELSGHRVPHRNLMGKAR
jgi:hypothetical protein